MTDKQLSHFARKPDRTRSENTEPTYLDLLAASDQHVYKLLIEWRIGSIWEFIKKAIAFWSQWEIIWNAPATALRAKQDAETRQYVLAALQAIKQALEEYPELAGHISELRLDRLDYRDNNSVLSLVWDTKRLLRKIGASRYEIDLIFKDL